MFPIFVVVHLVIAILYLIPWVLMVDTKYTKLLYPFIIQQGICEFSAAPVNHHYLGLLDVYQKTSLGTGITVWIVLTENSFAYSTTLFSVGYRAMPVTNYFAKISNSGIREKRIS